MAEAPQGSAWPYLLTRRGALHVDESGRKVLVNGLPLMGRSADEAKLSPISLSWNGSWEPGKRSVEAWRVSTRGEVTAQGSDGWVEIVSRIVLATPEPTTRLWRISESWFAMGDRGVTDGPPLQWPGDGGAGSVKVRSLEVAPVGMRVGAFDRSTPGAGQAVPVPVPSGWCVLLEGPGFLSVRDPGTDEHFLTRCGLLKLDSEGWLVTEKRSYRVQVFSDEPFPGVRDLRVPVAKGTGRLTLESRWIVESLGIDVHGFISLKNTEGVRKRLGRLKIDRLSHAARSVAADGYFWKARPDRRLVDQALGVNPIPGGLGTRIRSGQLDPSYLDAEASNALNHRARFLQQPHVREDSSTALAIGGAGFFLVRNPATAEVLMTRSGRFRWTGDGHLENDRGWRVQGLVAPGQTAWEDVRVAGRSPWVMGNLVIDESEVGNGPRYYRIVVDEENVPGGASSR